jgi:hypothetical protein
LHHGGLLGRRHAKLLLLCANVVHTVGGMKTEKIVLRVEPEELEQFSTAARREGLSLSAWIRRLLLLELKRSAP